MNIKAGLNTLKLRYAKANKRRLVITTLAVVSTFAFLTYITLLKNQPKAREVAPEQAAEATQEPKEDVPTQEQAIDAAIRAHERSTKVCYDPAIEGFLIHYPYMKPAEDGTTYFDGWYYLKYQQMWKTDNGIWFMKDYSPSEYVRVYPDVTGLNCKNT
jgi:hypothetical protein